MDQGEALREQRETNKTSNGDRSGEHRHADVKLKDIKIGAVDSRGHTIDRIFTVKPGEYKVYWAEEVVVQFSDDPETAKAQRDKVRPLGFDLAEINGLLYDWKRRDEFDRKIAYGFRLALEDNLDGAKQVIAKTKDKLLNDRANAGKKQYFICALIAGAAIVAVLFLFRWLYPFDKPSENLWLAARAGLVGALYSIAFALQERRVALDYDRAANITDGVLRLGIGAVSGAVLLLILRSGILPSAKIGEAVMTGDAMTWQIVVVIGFIGGFLERFVPDLLEKYQQKAA